jgi:hypothetical protein
MFIESDQNSNGFYLFIYLFSCIISAVQNKINIIIINNNNIYSCIHFKRTQKREKKVDTSLLYLFIWFF